MTMNRHNKGNYPNAFSDTTSWSELPNAIKTLTDPGKDQSHLLMRSNFKNERQHNAHTVLTAWIESHMGLERGSPLEPDLEMVHSWLAGSDSIQAERTRKVVESIIGQHRPAGIRKSLGFKRKEAITDDS
jgi:hypothetical protein